MEYSVYIIQDRGKDNQHLFNNLAGDVDFGDHLKNTGAAAVADAVGANILDRYATDEMVGNNGVVINGEMIDSVSVKAELIKKNMFVEVDEGGVKRKENKSLPFILRTITVKGNLFAPSFIEMKSGTIKNKDMSRIMAWASLAPTSVNNNWGEDYVQEAGKIGKKKGFQLYMSTHIDYEANYKNYYYRRVLVTTYSNTDSQFRAVLYDKVFVSNYEEVYNDKDGNGKFTLVMQSIAASVFDVIVAGPTYDTSLIAFTDQISSVAQKHSKTVANATENVVKATGNSDLADDIKNVTDKINSAAETADSTRDGITIDSTFDNIGKQADTYSDPTQQAIDQAAKYKEAYGKLTDEQKATLDNIPDFKKMSIEDKLKHINKLTS